MKTSPLVIIDMQEDFLDSPCEEQTNLVNSVVRAVSKVKAQNRRIVLVEYEGCGPTISPIRTAIGRYAKLSVVKKAEDNGAVEVQKALYRKRHGKVVTVCGVNLEACVFDTVTGLVCAGFTCRVLREATANAYGTFRQANTDYPSRVLQNSKYFTPSGTYKDNAVERRWVGGQMYLGEVNDPTKKAKSIRVIGVRYA